jgi:hypothetical protein
VWRAKLVPVQRSWIVAFEISRLGPWFARQSCSAVSHLCLGLSPFNAFCGESSGSSFGDYYTEDVSCVCVKNQLQAINSPVTVTQLDLGEQKGTQH